jgi:PAS domain-containing protein
LIFLLHVTDTFPNPLFNLNIQRYYLSCNSAFVSLTGKDFEDIAGKTNDEISGSGETDLFDMYTADLFEYIGMKTYTGLFHYPDGYLSKFPPDINNDYNRTNAMGYVGLFSHLKVLKK